MTLVQYMFILAVLIAPHMVQAAAWQATAGAQSDDKARQAIAFLPNELSIHAGDSITWTHNSDDAHTVTFLRATDLRPVNPAAGQTPDGSSFDGTGPTFVNSGFLFTVGEKYTVTFPTAGNFKLVCLVHVNMTGSVHVLERSAPLPHDQAFYDEQGERERIRLLSDRDPHGENDRAESSSPDGVRVGSGEVVVNGGGSQGLSIVRFQPGTTVVHAGDTVEWTNMDSANEHTVTFGPEPAAAPIPVNVNPSLDDDGALHAIVDSLAANETVHSGILQAIPQDRAVVASLPLAVTDLVQYPLPAKVVDVNQRFRVTFTRPGVFTYRCIFHDNLGMVGQVVVKP